MTVFRKLQKKPKRIPKTAVSTTVSHAQNHIYYFGSFFLNQLERQLSRNGKTVRLAPKTFDVLLVLIQNKGCLVTKERLLREVWPDVFVEEANLSVNIASLRKTLDEDDAEGQWIETVPKQGYRFVAHVSELTGEDVVEKPHLAGGCNGKNAIVNSIAVLPFENEGCGPVGEYLSSGLMESITNSLSRSRDLRVMARHAVYACHQCHMDPRVVGHKLGVRSVLVGRILRLGDRLIVRTELVDVMNGWQLWGEQYLIPISDVLTVQQELTAAISERLRTRLSLDEERPGNDAVQLMSKHATPIA
jgi:DNA-binding winged helix-turn-helix (wHTH) protein